MQKIIYKNKYGDNMNKIGKVIFRSPKGTVIFKDNEGEELIIKKEQIIRIEKLDKMKTLKKW